MTFIIGDVTERDAWQLREIHVALEAIGARGWAEIADDDALARLRRAYERVARYVESDAGPDLVRHAKDRFFRALFEGAGSSVVPESLRRIKHRMSAVRAASLALPGRPGEMLAELGAILDAAAAQDTQALLAACSAHLDREVSSGVRALASRPASGRDAARPVT